MRLSEDWWPGEWLEPVHPDIVRPFVERYLTTMATMRADYLRAQLALIARTEGTDDTDAWEGDTPEPDDAQSSADAGLGNARRSVSFLNLCLIVDQEWTFPVGTRNLRAIGYRPSEEGYAEASMALREEFDRFADFLTGLGPTPGRREVAEAIERKYHYEGDIESWRFLDALARRASRRLVADMLDRWAARSQAAIRGDDAANGTEDAGPVGKVTHTLSQWGLARAIRSYPPYEGRCRTLGPDVYRQYLTMIGKKPKADETDDGRRHTVWVFPNMGRELDGKTDESGRESWQVRADEVSAKQGSHGTEDMGIGFTSGDGSDDDIGRDESWSRFHAVTDDAVNTWLGAETVHAAGLDGHGHALSYRAKDPVVTYQDVNAWRLDEALERYEGPAAWGSGGRLADLYRTRGHLDKGGKPAADRSVRDYAASARGTADAIQYLAAITGLGAMGMLADAERVERFIRIIDRCGQRLGGPAADRFGKAQWSLINVAKDKRHRLTVLDETGRRASAVALLAAMDVTIRKAGTDGGDATTAPAGDPDAIARMARSLKIDRLLRAWGVTDAKGISGGGYGPRDWLTVANAIDLAEHTMRSAVHGLMRKELGGPHRTADGRPPVASSAAGQALGRSRWLARLAATPMPCLGQAMTALIGNNDGTCLFHRSATDRSATTNGRSAR